MNKSEEKIIKKAIAGDRLAFRELVLENSHAMFRLAWRLCGDEGLAEDIVQDAFIKAWRKIGDFRMQSGFRSWLHRITVNTAMDHLRKQASRKRHETAEPEWERIQQASEAPKHDVQIDIRTRTRAAMMKLSETERSALMLRHFEGHSIAEIAQILDLTTGACKQTVFRAVKKMRVELKPLVAT
jgi:RNA polymerase sigma-70 factor (ECF subfamily)